MNQGYGRRGARVRAAERDRKVPAWVWLLLAGGLIAAMPTLAQTSDGSVTTSPVPGAQGSAEGAAPSGQVPEVVQPRGPGGSIPSTGVIQPPANGAANATPVLRPAPGTAGTMPVIPPPGSAGGDTRVVPK